MKNTAFLGKGVVFNKYTRIPRQSGCNDANPEFIAELRRIMEEEDVMFQTAELGRIVRAVAERSPLSWPTTTPGSHRRRHRRAEYARAMGSRFQRLTFTKPTAHMSLS